MSLERFIAEVFWAAILQHVPPEDALEFQVVRDFFEQLMALRFCADFDLPDDTEVCIHLVRLNKPDDFIILNVPDTEPARIDPKEWN